MMGEEKEHSAMVAAQMQAVMARRDMSEVRYRALAGADGHGTLQCNVCRKGDHILIFHDFYSLFQCFDS